MRRRLALAGIAVAAVGFGGCGPIDSGTDLVNGKELFVANCSSCHVLQRAGTGAPVGPNLDQAFARARKDGFPESTFEGIVRAQIEAPARNPSRNPQTGEPLPVMPPNLVTGSDADDVAAYVASAVSKPGEDTGRLADIGAQAEGTAEAENGTLEIPAVDSGAPAFEFADATAPPGALTIASPNPSSVEHNIALEGGGVDEVGPVVADGGVSEIEVDVQAGEYTFYCSVPGHREGGMEGTLTVE